MLMAITKTDFIHRSTSYIYTQHEQQTTQDQWPAENAPRTHTESCNSSIFIRQCLSSIRCKHQGRLGAKQGVEASRTKPHCEQNRKYPLLSPRLPPPTPAVPPFHFVTATKNRSSIPPTCMYVRRQEPALSTARNKSEGRNSRCKKKRAHAGFQAHGLIARRFRGWYLPLDRESNAPTLSRDSTGKSHKKANREAVLMYPPKTPACSSRGGWRTRACCS